DSDLDGLTRQHDAWQEIDARIRRIENSIRGNTKELDDAWPWLGELIAEQLGTDLLGNPLVPPPYRGPLQEAREALDRAAGQPDDPAVKRSAFFRLRRAAVEWFQALDQSLLNTCNELKQIDAVLTAILSTVRESIA
ncbi:MAG TPA: hypothetical protein VF590_22825, partial [Isosphaeraceae bacterium]